jgi:hypothetical protein
MCAFCSADQIYAHLDGFGAVGRHLQLVFFATVDIVVPTLSGLFGALAITLLTRSRRASWPRVRWLAVVPIAAALLDFTENGLIAVLTTRYPERMERVATMTGLVTGVKTSAYLLTAVMLVVFGALTIASRTR